MSTSIPTTEPLSVRAGETWRWSRSLADYPAPTWELIYTLFSAGGLITITAVADGTDHLVNVAPDATAAKVAGRYDWIAQVTNSTDKFQVGSGAIDILPAITAAYDGRSHARKMLEAINALIEQRATDGDLDLVRSTVGDRATETDLSGLMKLRQQYAAAVVAEDQSAAAARGDRSSFVQMRF